MTLIGEKLKQYTNTDDCHLNQAMNLSSLDELERL